MRKWCTWASATEAIIAVLLLHGSFGTAGAGPAFEVQFLAPRAEPETYANLILPTVSAAPTPDGHLDDPCWQKAMVIEPFFPCGGPDLVAAQTQALLCCDNAHLYVALRCTEPSLESLKTSHSRHGEEVFHDDSVAVFLDSASMGVDVAHLAVNARGVKYAGRCDGLGDIFGTAGPPRLFSRPDDAAAWRAGVARDATSWTAEFSIPAQAITGRREILPGEIWRIGLRRQRAGARWPKVTSACAFAAAQPDMLPPMRPVQLGIGPIGFQVLAPDNWGWGDNEAVIRLTNPGAKALSLSVQAVVAAPPAGEPARLYSQRLDVAPGGDLKLRLPYHLPSRGGRCAVLFSAVGAGGQPVYAVQEHRVVLPTVPLAVQSTDTHMLLGERWQAQVRIFLGVGELKRAHLSVSMCDTHGATMAHWEGPCPSEHAIVRLDTKGAPPGNYQLKFRLAKTQGESLAERSLNLRLVPRWRE